MKETAGRERNFLKSLGMYKGPQTTTPTLASLGRPSGKGSPPRQDRPAAGHGHFLPHYDKLEKKEKKEGHGAPGSKSPSSRGSHKPRQVQINLFPFLGGSTPDNQAHSQTHAKESSPSFREQTPASNKSEPVQRPQQPEQPKAAELPKAKPQPPTGGMTSVSSKPLQSKPVVPMQPYQEEPRKLQQPQDKPIEMGLSEEEMQMIEDHCATRIQAWWKGFLARRVVREIREELLREEELRIQEEFRREEEYQQQLEQKRLEEEHRREEERRRMEQQRKEDEQSKLEMQRKEELRRQEEQAKQREQQQAKPQGQQQSQQAQQKMRERLQKEQEARQLEQQRREHAAAEVICRAVWRYVLKKREGEHELLQKYLNHCAIIIQRKVRRWLGQKNQFVRAAVAVLEERLLGLFKGWKVRRVLQIKRVEDNVREFKELLGQLEHTQGNTRDFRRKLENQVKAQREVTLQVFEDLMHDPRWLRKLRGSKVNTLSNKRPDSGNKAAQMNAPIVANFSEERPGKAVAAKVRPETAAPLKPNAWEERENMPIKSRQGDQPTYEEFLEMEKPIAELPEEVAAPAEGAEQKKNFLKRRTKYDPMKSIREEKLRKQQKPEVNEGEEAPRGQEGPWTHASPHSKSTTYRGVQHEDESNTKRGGQLHPEDMHGGPAELHEGGELGYEGGSHEGEFEGGKSKKGQFLKRKSKAVQGGKLNWGGVGSRIDCWVNRKGPGENTNVKGNAPGGRRKEQSPGVSKRPGASQLSQRKGSPVPNTKKETQSPHAVNKMSPGAASREKMMAKMASSMGAHHPPHQGGRTKMIHVHELEKAYSINFYPKSIVVNSLFEYVGNKTAASGGFGPASLIPTIKSNCQFVRKTITTTFEDAVNDLNDHYQMLCEVN